MKNKERREIKARNTDLPDLGRRDSDVEHNAPFRHEIALLAREGCVGLECGVASGEFSEALWNTGRFSSFHAVDKWDDLAHPTHEYYACSERLIKYPEVKLWHMTAQTFAKIALAAEMKFGFIYIDCYAHTGQDEGGVLEALYPLLEEGGVFSGDDYDAKAWPQTVAAVNRFAEREGKTVQPFDRHLCNGDQYDKYLSWYFYK